MKKLVVGSKQNIASVNILKELGGVENTLISEHPIVDLRELEKVKADLVIVASSHKSASGRPTLTAHAPGNFGPAELGGKPGKLSISPALYVSEAVREFHRLKNERSLPYEVSLEVTHHGPSFDLPIVFVEVGSGEKQWKDGRATGAAARVIEHLLDVELEGDALVGVGGPHYAPGFTELVLAGHNVGHICPRYASAHLSREMLVQMIEKTVPRPEKVVLDWKGVKGDVRQAVLKWGKELGLDVLKVKDLKKAGEGQQ